MYKTSFNFVYPFALDDQVMELFREFTGKLEQLGVECKGDQVMTEAYKPESE